MDKFIIAWSTKYGYCKWYDDPSESDYWNYMPLEIYAMKSQAITDYYRNIQNTRWLLP